MQRDVRRLSTLEDLNFTLVIDDEEIDVLGHKCYVVNSARTGTGLAISENFKVDDGLLDIFVLAKDWKSSNAALDRFFGLENKGAGMYYWQGQKIIIHADQDQPVWTDGEYTGRTPVTMAVVPGGLTVAVPFLMRARILWVLLDIPFTMVRLINGHCVLDSHQPWSRFVTGIFFFALKYPFSVSTRAITWPVPPILIRVLT